MNTGDKFDNRSITPMLIGKSEQAFDSMEYLYELKLDGVRCLAYIDEYSTDLRNKRNMRMLPQFPELKEMAFGTKCVLDGELIVTHGSRPAFTEVQRRTIMNDNFKISITAKQALATFVAFNILYTGEEGLITSDPLEQRKKILFGTVRESKRLKLSKHIYEAGKKLYELVENQGLEGIVAKKKGSLYHEGKRSNEWIKIKNLQDDDFIVLGYIQKDNHMYSIVLGQYKGANLTYKGHVTLGVSGPDFAKIRAQEKLQAPPLSVPNDNETATWVIPELVCTIQFMERTGNGSMRQPVFKGLRDDKSPEDCVERE